MNMTPKMEEEVLAVLRQPMDDVVGWVCHALETIFNGVMEVEAQRLTRRRSGKGPALDHRSGFYTRTYPSPFGPLELKEPRLRRSPFASALLACFEARQKKVKELVTAMHHEGLGTRPISRIMEDHLEEGMSHTTVSRICREAHVELEAWRTRPLTGPYPILALDAQTSRYGYEPRNLISPFLSVTFRPIAGCSLGADLRLGSLPDIALRLAVSF